MKKNKKILAIFTGILAAGLVIACQPAAILAGAVVSETEPAEEVVAEAAVSAETPAEGSSAESKAPEIDLNDAVYLIIENGQITYIDDISRDYAETYDTINEKNVSFDGSTLTLKEGTFVLSGNLEGTVNIQAGKKNETLVALNGFTLTNPEGTAFSCKKTAGLTVYLMEGTVNNVTSGEETEINEDCIKLTADASGGAFQTKSDTVITGGGQLNIFGYINNGLQASGKLTVEAGEINISAANNGIKVKDTYTGNGGVIYIHSGGDGLKASQEATDAQEAVYDEETGELIQEAVEEVAASGTVIINGGTYTIDSYDDSIQTMIDLTINGGDLTLGATGTYNSKGSYTKTRDKTFSAKGLKSDGTLTVNGGKISMRTYSNGLSSSELLSINNGDLYIYCGNAGLHSDVRIDINGGIVNIANAYEGIEANNININDGIITIRAWDDGMNANGGNGFGSRGGNANTAKEMPELNINGGEIYVNADGDGIDSNGNITVTGGKMVVDGPTSSWNGPLDSGMENGGTIIITGGTVFAGGASGMAESFSTKSEQYSFMAKLNSKYSQGAVIRVLTVDGEELFNHTVASSGSSIVFSCPEFKKDETYILMIDDAEYEITLTSISTSKNLR